MTTGVLLLNLGTPAAPTTRAVRSYLFEFLSDPRVVDLPKIVRYLLLYAVILPFRSPRSAKAYQQIWMQQGSPLLYHSQALSQRVQESLGEQYCVRLAMRYGEPSVPAELKYLFEKSCERVIVLPLFPHYAAASYGSAAARVLECAAGYWNLPELQLRGDFFDHPGFIDSWVAVMKEPLRLQNPEVVIFSFHGLPERHLDKSGCKRQFCSRQAVCPAISQENRFCYRAQCFATVRSLLPALGLTEAQCRVAFQSRLGKIPWIIPDINTVLAELAEQGVKRIAVVCPSFVADCLETLEEIGIRARAYWQELGGSEFNLLPCLNTHPVWVRAVTQMVMA